MSVARKILIVDDNDTVLMALEYNIKQAGYSVIKASDGEQALSLAVAESPDIIVSDITMPELDGMELCRKIRSMPKLADVPFIFLTAHGEPDERVKGLRSGADDYMVKPFDVEELIARIDVLYGNIRKRRFSNTLSGNIAELAIADTLQIFAQSKKEGNLIIRTDDQSGFISFRDGNLVDASFMEESGEDALALLLQLDSGHFHYEPGEVRCSDVGIPVNYAMLETIRLIDERCDLAGWVPDLSKRVVALGKELHKDQDIKALQTAILQKESVTGTEAWKASGLSRIRAEAGLALLVRDGWLGVDDGTHLAVLPKVDAARFAGKPIRVLLVFTDEQSASSFLANVAETFQVRSSHGIKSGVADFLKVTVENVAIQIFTLRGEKKFSFLWEPMLPSTSAVIFLLHAPADREHVTYFREKLVRTGKDIPFLHATFNAAMSDESTSFVDGNEKMITFFTTLLNRIPQLPE